jgi:ABC-2 type transport system permease protein
VSPPSELHMLWLIARRAALEAFRDRMTLLMSLFFALVLPFGVLIFSVRPQIDSDEALGVTLAMYLLLIGLMPAVSAVGIAAGQFAGEKERGILTPLLATPASNMAIFGGKVLGAILPPLTYAALGDTIFLAGVAVMLGPSGLHMIPPTLGIAMLILVPGMTTFAATVASLISSRVRTFNSAQQLSGLALLPAWGILGSVALKLPEWGTVGLIVFVGGVIVLDVVLLSAAAATWRREEVLSHT